MEAFRRAVRNQSVDKNMFPTLLKRACDKLFSQPELAKSGFRGAGLFPVNKSEPAKKIIRSDREAPLDSPRKAILKIVQATLSPEVDPDIAEAIKRRRQKRKRVQAEAGEVLTETAVERMRIEEEERQRLAAGGKVPKAKGPKGKGTKGKAAKDKKTNQRQRNGRGD